MDPCQFAAIAGLDHLLMAQERLISRGQAYAVGFTDRQIDRRVYRRSWLKVRPQVYLVPESGVAPSALTESQRVRAVWLWAGAGAVIAMDAAAWWLGLTIGAAPSVVEVWIPGHRSLRPRPGIRVRRRDIDPRDVREHFQIAVTSTPRTAIDLAAVENTDPLDTLVRQKRVFPDTMRRVLDRGSGGRGWIQAREAFNATLLRPWSRLERTFQRDLIEIGVTDWVANIPLEFGEVVQTPDIRMKMVPLLIELDGREFHNTDKAFEEDHLRDTVYVRGGWTPLRFTYKQVVHRKTWTLDSVLAMCDLLRGRPMPEVRIHAPSKHHQRE